VVYPGGTDEIVGMHLLNPMINCTNNFSRGLVTLSLAPFHRIDGCHLSWLDHSVQSFHDYQIIIKNTVGAVACQGFQRLEDAIAFVGWQTSTSSSPPTLNVPQVVPAPPAPRGVVPIAPFPTPIEPKPKSSQTTGTASPQDNALPVPPQQATRPTTASHESTSSPTLNSVEAPVQPGQPNTQATPKRSESKPKTLTVWDQNFQKLKAFNDKHGHCDVTSSMVDRDNSFLAWFRYNRERCGRVQLWRQRKAAGEDVSGLHIGRKDEEKVDMMLTLGVKPTEFSIAPNGKKLEKRWEQRFQELKEYKERNRTLEVPAHKHPQLYAWANYQSASLSKDPPQLSEDQRQRLLDLGVTPREGSAPKKSSFEDMFQLLVKFQESHGHCNVPVQARQPLDHWSSGLRNWVENLRDNFERFKRGQPPISPHNAALDPQRIAQLTKLGLTLQKVRRERFDTRAAEWFDYFTTHGKNPSHGEDQSDEQAIRLAKWVAKTRRYYWRKKAGGNAGSLTDEWQDRLTSWGFDWNRKIDIAPVAERRTWDEQYLDLVEYKNKNGDVDVPQLYATLGRWVHRQRRQYRHMKQGKKSSLTKDRIEKLVKLGFKWITRKSPGSRNTKDSTPDSTGELDLVRFDQQHRLRRANATFASPGTGGEHDYSSSDDESDGSSDAGLQTLPRSARGTIPGYIPPPPWDRYRV